MKQVGAVKGAVAREDEKGQDLTRVGRRRKLDCDGSERDVTGMGQKDGHGKEGNGENMPGDGKEGERVGMGKGEETVRDERKKKGYSARMAKVEEAGQGWERRTKQH